MVDLACFGERVPGRTEAAGQIGRAIDRTVCALVSRRVGRSASSARQTPPATDPRKRDLKTRSGPGSTRILIIRAVARRGARHAPTEKVFLSNRLHSPAPRSVPAATSVVLQWLYVNNTRMK